MDMKLLKERAEAIAEWAIEKRRALHRIPETGFKEFRTQALIKETLDELGIPYTCERTWVVAEVKGAYPGPTVALRADIDALPVEEPEGCPFRSENPGWMHACGHDAHTAIQLGAAKLLNGMRDELCGSVRLLFQPAEETEGGAKPMAEAGVMEGVSHVYGLHVQPYLNVGQIDSRHGTLNASTDEVEIIVHGVSSHAARPESGVDAIVCAGHLIAALQTVVSRSVSPLKSGVLSFGVIEGGTARNIICDRVRLNGTLRTADPELRKKMIGRIRDICSGVGAALGTTVEVNIVPGYAALVNDNEEVDRVFRLGAELLGSRNVRLREEPSMGGEDFSYFLERAKGAFYHLGCSAPEDQPAPALHHRNFRVDERCLKLGVALQSALVLDHLLKED